MSDTAVNETSNAHSLDGEVPRLGGSAPMLPAVPPATAFTNVDSGPTVPVLSQVLTDGSAPTLPTLPTPTLPSPTLPSPTLPSPVAPIVTTGDAPEVTATAAEGRHPMAHLMPEKIKPSEASMRAAELRAAKKAKARKVKIGVAIGAVVVTAIVGPPLASWTIDAINEAGSTKSEDPAPATTVAATTDPEATPAAGVQAIEDAEQLTNNTTP